MPLIIVTATIIIVGLIAIALAHPRRPDAVVWNDETERRLLHERNVRLGWW